MRPPLALRPLALFCLLLAVPLRANDVTVALKDQKQNTVVDAVVSLVPLDAGIALPSSPASAVEIEQVGQEFIPFVTVVRTGTSVRFPNRDTVEHYVYSESPAKPIQLPLYAPGKDEVITFERPGVVPLGCNIHDWMLAYVVIVDTPWFVRTEAAGSATLRGVPPGRYRVDIWHPRLPKPETRNLTVQVGEPAAIDLALTLKPDRRIRRPQDGAKAGYR